MNEKANSGCECNKTTHQHAKKSSEHLLSKEIILEALNILPGQTVLDVGCGDGYMSKAFSKLVASEGKVYALEPCEESIKQLEQETRGTNIETVQGKITVKTKFEKSSMDIIYISNVLHGFTKDQVDFFVKEVKRLLKKGGRLVITEIKKEPTPFGPPMHIRYSPADLKKIISLKPVSVIEPGKHFYTQIFENK